MTGTQIAVLVILLLCDLLVVGFIGYSLLGDTFENILGCYFLACFLWLIIDWFLFLRFGGPLKRGVIVWRERLPQDEVLFFRELSRDIQHDDGFIRTDSKAVIIRATRPMLWRTSWPYVAYIDLLRVKPRIEYRMPWPSLLIMLPFLMHPLGMLFVTGMLLLNHLVEKKTITNFITESRRNYW